MRFRSTSKLSKSSQSRTSSVLNLDPLEAKVSIRSSFSPPQKFINLSPGLLTFRMKLKVSHFRKFLKIQNCFDFFSFLFRPVPRTRTEHRSAWDIGGLPVSSANRDSANSSSFRTENQKCEKSEESRQQYQFHFGKNYFPSFFTLIIFPACGSATVIVLLRNYQ